MIISNEITFCLTSCNRNDLLFKTLDSFIELNKYPIKEWFIKEDSGIEKVMMEIKEKYPFINVIGGENIGQAESIDLLYSFVNSKYIFHCEEDWVFKGNHKFIEQSLSILENFTTVHQVWIRKFVRQWSENWQDFEDFKFGIIKDNHIDTWNGFSWNPGLRRLEDYKLMFPDGFKKHVTKYKSGAFIERDCMLNTKKFNYRAAILDECVCEHIGGHNSTWKV